MSVPDPITPDSEASDLRLDDIVEDEAISLRLRVRSGQTERLAQLMREQGIDGFPPVVVAGPRPDDGAYVVLDGRYRLDAARRIGLTSFRALIRPWAEPRELFLESVRLSSRHGLAMTHVEKRRAVDQLVREFSEEEKSTRELAEIAGVSHNFVAVRRRLWKQGTLPAREPAREKQPEYYAARLVRALDGLRGALGAAALDPGAIGAVLARAALHHFADADPARELQVLAAAARDGGERARRELVRAPGPAKEAPARARDLAGTGGAAL